MCFCTSCTLTTLKYIQISCVQYCPLINYTKIVRGVLTDTVSILYMIQTVYKIHMTISPHI